MRRKTSGRRHRDDDRRRGARPPRFRYGRQAGYRADAGLKHDTVLQQMNGDLYALSGQAVRLIAQGRLDRRLFDLTLLAKDGYDDAHTGQLPVITTYENVVPKAVPHWTTGPARASRSPSWTRASTPPTRT